MDTRKGTAVSSQDRRTVKRVRIRGPITLPYRAMDGYERKLCDNGLHRRH